MLKLKKNVIFRLHKSVEAPDKEAINISKELFMFLFHQESRVAANTSPYRKYADVVVFDLTQAQFDELVKIKDKDRFEWSEFFNTL